MDSEQICNVLTEAGIRWRGYHTCEGILFLCDWDGIAVNLLLTQEDKLRIWRFFFADLPEVYMGLRFVLPIGEECFGFEVTDELAASCFFTQKISVETLQGLPIQIRSFLQICANVQERFSMPAGSQSQHF